MNKTYFMSSMYYSLYTLVYIIYIYKDILSLVLSFLERAEMPTEMPTESPGKTATAVPNDHVGLPNDYIDRTTRQTTLLQVHTGSW